MGPAVAPTQRRNLLAAELGALMILEKIDERKALASSLKAHPCSSKRKKEGG